MCQLSPNPCTHSGSDLPQPWVKRSLGLVDTWWPTAAPTQPWAQRPLLWNLLSSPCSPRRLEFAASAHVCWANRQGKQASTRRLGVWQPARGLAAASQGQGYPLGHSRGPTGVSPGHCSPSCSHRSVKGKDRGRGGLGDHLFCHLSGDRSPSKRLRGEVGWCYRPNGGLGIIYGFHLSVFPLVSLVVGN